MSVGAMEWSFDASGCVSTLLNVDWIKRRYFCVNEFGVGVNDCIFSANEQQKVLYINTDLLVQGETWGKRILRGTAAEKYVIKVLLKVHLLHETTTL